MSFYPLVSTSNELLLHCLLSMLSTEYLSIADNRLTGTLPPEVGYMVNLSKSGYLVVHTLCTTIVLDLNLL